MKDKALAARLKSLSGHSFDKAYIEAMVKDHRADLMAFKKEASTGTDSSLKDAASRGSEVISNHLHMIEDIAKSHSVTVGQ
jgi:putative membrane protein